ERVEYKGQADAHRLRHQPAACEGLAHPVSKIDKLRGATPDVGERDAAHQGVAAVVEENEEGIVGPRLSFFPRALDPRGKDAAAEIGFSPARLEGPEEVPACPAQG